MLNKRVLLTLFAAISFTLFSFIALLSISTPETALPQTFALVIRDDPAGGDCSSVGDWDQASRTCTLSRDLSQQILIDSDGITLDGNGHRITGNGPADPAQYVYGRDGGGDAVQLYNRAGVTIKGLTIRQFDYGIRLENSSGNTIQDNNTYLMGLSGVSLHHSASNIITGNNLSNPHISSGICVGYASSNNEISNNIFSGNDRGAYIHTLSHGNNFTNNNLDQNLWAVTVIEASSGNNFIGNNFTDNSFALSVHDSSSQNTVADNIISGNNTGVYLNATAGNTFFHNIFTLNQVHVSANNAGANSFTLPLPEGGNYWGDFDEPLEGCEDLDGDQICDEAYQTQNVLDNLPWTCQNGWSCGRPSLGITSQNPYWESLADYEARLLSVPFDITSHKGDTTNLSLVNATCTNGAVSISDVPAALGDLEAGGHAYMMVKYMVPPGVSSFNTTLYVSTLDACMATHYFPGPAY